MPEEPRFLTPSHAAIILRCSTVQVQLLFDRGLLRGVRDSGGRRLIYEASVEEYRRTRKRRRRPHAGAKPQQSHLQPEALSRNGEP
jgi:hypothetical protein